jgi:hypothetical protein
MPAGRGYGFDVRAQYQAEIIEQLRQFGGRSTGREIDDVNITLEIRRSHIYAP